MKKNAQATTQNKNEVKSLIKQISKEPENDKLFEELKWKLIQLEPQEAEEINLYSFFDELYKTNISNQSVVENIDQILISYITFRNSINHSTKSDTDQIILKEVSELFFKVNNKLKEIAPNTGKYYYQKGKVLKDIFKDNKEAFIEYNNAIKFDQNNAKYYSERARIYGNKFKDYDKALQDLNVAIKLDSNNFSYYQDRSKVYIELKKYDKALTDISKAISLIEEEKRDSFFISMYYVDRAVLYHFYLKDYNMALNDYNKIIEIKPEYSSNYTSRGGCYKELGDNESALVDFNKAIELEPESSSNYSSRGGFYKELGDNENALVDYNKAIELKPEYSSNYMSRGDCYKELGDNESALVDFNKAIELEPKNDGYYFQRNLLYCELSGMYERQRKAQKRIDNGEISGITDFIKTFPINNQYLSSAVEDMKMAISLSPKNDHYYCIIYHSLNVLGNGDSALDYINKAIEINPIYDYYLFRQDLFVKMEKYQEALKDIFKMEKLRERTEDDTIDLYKAIVYEKMKDYEKYAKYISKSENQSKDYGYHLAALNCRNDKNYSKAIRLINKAIRLYPDNDEYYSIRASIYYNMGDFQNSISDYEYLISKSSEGNGPLNYNDRLAISYCAMERYDKALQVIEKAIVNNVQIGAAYIIKSSIYETLKDIKSRNDSFREFLTLLKSKDFNELFVGFNVPALNYIASVYQGLNEHKDLVIYFDNLIKANKTKIKSLLGDSKFREETIQLLNSIGISLSLYFDTDPVDTERILNDLLKILPCEVHYGLFNSFAYITLSLGKKRKLTNFLNKVDMANNADAKKSIIRNLSVLAEYDQNDILMSNLLARKEFTREEKIEAGFKYISDKLIKSDTIINNSSLIELLSKIRSLIGVRKKYHLIRECINYTIGLLNNKSYDISDLFKSEEQDNIDTADFSRKDNISMIGDLIKQSDTSIDEYAQLQDTLSQIFWYTQKNKTEYMPYIYQVLNSYLFYRSKKREKELMASKAAEGTISILAHSIKNPAFVMKSQADILSKEINKSDLKDKKIGRMIKKTVSERFKMMEQSSADIVDIVNVLRTIQKVDIDNEIEFNLKHLTDECHNNIEIMLNEYIGDEYLYKQAKGKGLKFVNNFPEEIKLKGEESAIKILVKDLILNAMLHAENNSELILNLDENNSKYLLKIKNCGEDLPEELKDIYTGKSTIDLLQIKTKKHLGSRIIKILSDKMKWKTNFVHADGVNEFIFEINKAGE